MIALATTLHAQQGNKTSSKKDPTAQMILRSNSRDKAMVISGNNYRRVVRLRRQEMIKRSQMQMQRKMQMNRRQQIMRMQKIRQQRQQRQMMNRRRTTGR